MKKFSLVFFAIPLLFVVPTSTMTVQSTTSFLAMQGDLENSTIQNIAASNDIYSYQWAGYATQYYLMEVTNIKNDATAQKVRDIALNMLGTDLTYQITFTNLSNVAATNPDDKYFFMNLAGSIVNISFYGMTSYQEFFAEAYSKWLTTAKAERNKSWEILDYYFENILPEIITNNRGSFTTTTKQAVEQEIDDYLQQNPAPTYDLSGGAKSEATLTSTQLQYVNDNFGFSEQIIGSSTTTYPEYAIAAALSFWNASGSMDMDVELTSDAVAAVNQSHSRKQYGALSFLPWTYETFVPASDAASKRFEHFVATTKQNYFDSFSKLTQNYLAMQKPTTNRYLDIATAVTTLAAQNNWSQQKLNNFEEQILVLFDVTYQITKSRAINGKPDLDYFLLGFIISPDFPLSGLSKETFAYTKIAYVFNGTSLLSTKYASIVYSERSLVQFSNESQNVQFQTCYWSTPNIYGSLDHEFGHLLDGLIGQTQSGAQNIRTNYSTIARSFAQIAYSGAVYGVTPISGTTGASINVLKIFLIGVGAGIGMLLLVSGIIFVIFRHRDRGPTWS